MKRHILATGTITTALLLVYIGFLSISNSEATDLNNHSTLDISSAVMMEITLVRTSSLNTNEEVDCYQ